MMIRAVAVALVLVISPSALPDTPLGWIGMAITPAPGQDRPAWLHVRHVTPGGPAEAAGIKTGDLITRIDRKAVAFKSDLEVLRFFGSLKPGQKLRLTVRRTDGETVITVTAARMPADVYERWKQTLARVEADAARQ